MLCGTSASFLVDTSTSYYLLQTLTRREFDEREEVCADELFFVVGHVFTGVIVFFMGERSYFSFGEVSLRTAVGVDCIVALFRWESSENQL